MCLYAVYPVDIRGLSETNEGKTDMPKKMKMKIFLALLLPMTLYLTFPSTNSTLFPTAFYKTDIIFKWSLQKHIFQKEFIRNLRETTIFRVIFLSVLP